MRVLVLAVVDTCPLTGSDVDAVLPVLPEVPTAVLSSQEVYAAFTGLRTGHEVAAVPITEDSELRAERYRRLRVYRRHIPIGVANLLWTGATLTTWPSAYSPR